jgi:phosphoribosyl 1,2-cyclic phosphodiesterase
MKLWVLGSGSKGNALLLECRETRVLVDAGFSARGLATRLASIGVAPESISALVLTHEHSDHVCGVPQAVKRWGWPVYGTAGTLAALAGMPAPPGPLTAGDSIVVGDIELTAVRTSHDAAEPVAYVATSTCSGMRTAIVTDLGRATAEVEAAVQHADVVVLESNHDEVMLRDGPYPWHLKRRVSGELGHLSNGAAAAMAARLAHRGLQQLVLAHLSQTNNTPEIALATAGSALRRTRWRGRLAAAPQDAVIGPFGDAGARAGQLSLF